MTDSGVDPLFRMRSRARLVWTCGWSLLATMIVGLSVAFVTGWIYASLVRFAFVLPGSCFVFLAWMRFGSRWALRAAPADDWRLLSRIGPLTRRVLWINLAVVVSVFGIWAWMERSPRILVGGAMALGIAAFVFFSISAITYGMFLASLYTRPAANARKVAGSGAQQAP